MELERPVNKNEVLRHVETVNFSEAVADAIELCIAASEALVINEVIKSNSFAEPSTASAILEAALQVKQARLEAWKTRLIGFTDEISEVDNLSDLDDITMESAYEDAGIHFNELVRNEVSVSQVKDTFDSECEENVKHEKTHASPTIFRIPCADRYTYRMKGVTNNVIQLRKELATECFVGDTKKKVINPVCDLGTDVSYHSDCLRTVEAQAKLLLSVSPEKGNRLAVEKNSHAKNVSSSPIKSCHEKDNSVPEIVQERFQSRWFGGWTSNNEVEYFNTVKHDILKPFAGETSFLSESADAAPDENSSVQNHDKGAIIASQLSMPSENFSNKANDRMVLSEDVVRSSSTSLVDPLCSVVPCSISEDICSSLAINHEDTAIHGSLNIMVECKKDNLLGISPSNNVPTEGEGIPVAIGNIKESRNGVSKRITLLKNYSKVLPSHSSFVKNNSHKQKSVLIDSNAELTLLETRFGNHEETVMGGADYPVSQKGNGATLPLVLNHREHCQLQAFSCSVHKLAEENPNQTALPESKMKCAPNLQRLQLECKNQSAQTLTASKRVHFSEKEINISDKKNLQKEQTVSKTCCSTRAAKRSTRSSVHLESKGPLMDKFLKVYLDKEKKRLIFQNMEFLLTGLSEKKEKEIEGLIRKYGGIVISQIPVTNLKGKRSSRFKSGVLPIVLCLKKIQSLKFLYGCAVNALVLKVNWLIDSIAVGFVLPTEKYASDVPKSTPCFISLLI
ncbi:UNVERIFIED_CONTAM: hypothetical protein Sradi_1076000 [Sesamum radiatum]|uniref:BRCT domain-containing protein n=1 Tax=Sesamum radiatum TaxID=300843 RepID=A0AAW2V841_SESRA